MSTYSSILAWRVPWTEEPGGLYMGLQRSETEQLTLKEIDLSLKFPLTKSGKTISWGGLEISVF